MTDFLRAAGPRGRWEAITIGLAALVSLAIAMGVGRFAFTPLFPLMVRDGLLTTQSGTDLAAGNYLGYLLGALLAGRVPLKAPALLAVGLIVTVAVTGAVGVTASMSAWVSLRFLAGVMSAWTFVATAAWGLGWLAALGHRHLSGLVFAGVGLGIAGVGLFCLAAARVELPAARMWAALAGVSGLLALFPLAVSAKFSAAPVAIETGPAPQPAIGPTSAGTNALILCYSLYGFGYILPATYIPELARQLVNDPNVFGWAWPLFGLAAALSAVITSWGLAKAGRLHVWSVSHVLMAAGVLLPVVWRSVLSLAIAAILVGGTFLVITLVAMQEARARAAGNATRLIARMTAGFALGQLLGPVVCGLLGRRHVGGTHALSDASGLAAAALLMSAIYLWRVRES